MHSVQLSNLSAHDMVPIGLGLKYLDLYSCFFSPPENSTSLETSVSYTVVFRRLLDLRVLERSAVSSSLTV